MAQTVLNIMLAKGKGGIEQAALDYAEALSLAGHRPISVLHPKGWAYETLMGAEQTDTNGETYTLSTLGAWDIFAARRLNQIAKQVQADIAICHGNRAISMALKAFKGRLPILGAAHNYKVKRFAACDGALCITRDLMNVLERQGLPAAKLFHMPNLVRPPERVEPKPFASPIRLKTMGRFVEKKGFRYFLEALTLLKTRGIAFEAEIGGDGPIREELTDYAAELSLSEPELRFSGWVTDKTAFWQDTDIFILPSLHEPFGMVLIEAMSHALPCITTRTEGPSEIASDGQNAKLIAPASACELADAILGYLDAPTLAQAHGAAARAHILSTYTLDHAAARLKAALSAFEKA